MKVLAINGSHRKGKNTALLLKLILEELEREGVETEFVEISDFKIEYCIACNRCLSKPECSIQDDDMKVLAEKLLTADAVIIGSPVYNANVTSRLKTFIDRTRWMHMRKELLHGKLGAAVVVAGLRNGGQEIAYTVLERFFASRGMKTVSVRDPEGGIYNMAVMATLFESLDPDSGKITWKRSVLDDELAVKTCKLLAKNILEELRKK